MLSIQLQHDVVIETINADFINRSISSKAKLDYIENVCRRNLDPKLVKSYSKSIIDPARMIKQAVSWQEKSPDMPEIHLLLARCNRHQEVFDAALDHYNKYLMVRYDKTVKLECLEMLIHNQQYSSALNLLQEIKAKHS